MNVARDVGSCFRFGLASLQAVLAIAAMAVATAGCGGKQACMGDLECMSRHCDNGYCTSASCHNGVQDNDETDVDCGGSCAGCADRKRCGVGTDCASQSCLKRACAHSCSDGVQNGDETDVDCGGSCGPCADGLACGRAADCASRSNCGLKAL